ncbi:zinc finger CCCH domain-containing protein 11A-like [Mytilus californianus]|uniref:zinc finger CCCH domain-containing protein 11A-like n=1 Tax=Mytilus californianus TaxID=6549 RepID=UPI00224825E4|nr:zinc finger CCCH domain-containing protein 11A-like [Mytilus californianus]XP_052066913.1 zinc finger CCCH domain-containing protein 11A-like [Mytilus californianus]
MSAYGNDCHFYYNSNCTKGENCAFRHCEAAKSSMVTCTFWQQGICSKPNCPYRHAELPPTDVFERNRQGIPCYWENQPVGCTRSNCQYQHFKTRPVVQGAQPLQTQPILSENQLPDTSFPPPLFGQQPPIQQLTAIPGAPVIQPVVVHFSDSEVESDKNSPVKSKKLLEPESTKVKLQSLDTTKTDTNNLSSSRTVTTSDLSSLRTVTVSNQSSLRTVTAPNQSTLTAVVPSQTITPIQSGISAFTSVQPSSIPSSIQSITSIKPVLPQTVQTIPVVSKQATVATIPEIDYFIGTPFLPKSIKSPPQSSPKYDSSPDRRSYDSRYSRSPTPRSMSPWRRRSRSPSPRRSRSPRRRSPFYSRDRSRSPRRWSPRYRSPSPRRRSSSPRRRTPPKNSVFRPQDSYLPSRRPVHERLNRDRNYPSTSLNRGRPEGVPQKKINLSKIKDKTESEEDNIKVKSLEEIQRAKALLSMGLIELKSGKIVKICEANKYQEEDEAEEEKKAPPKKKKIVKKISSKSKKVENKTKPVVKKVEKIEKKEESEEEKEEEEENFDDGDDLGEEPEIDICEATEEWEEQEFQKEESQDEDEEVEDESEQEEEEGEESEPEPEPVEYQQDIRRAVRKEDVEKKIIQTSSQVKRKRKVIVDEEEKKSKDATKVSVQSRLGRKLNTPDVRGTKHAKPQLSRHSAEAKVTNLQRSLIKASVKSRLEMKKVKPEDKVDNLQRSLIKASVKSRLETKKVKPEDKVDNLTRGTIKLSTGGIKSRLGIGANVSSSKSDTISIEPRTISMKRTIENDQQDQVKKEVLKKRRWNQGSIKSRLGDSASDTSVTDSDLKKIVIVRNLGDEDSSRDGNRQKETRESVQSASNENTSQIKSTLSRINKIIEDKKVTQEPGALNKGRGKLNVWSSRVSETIAAVAPTKKESNIDLFDSSSNDSLAAEHGMSKIETKKGPKIERALYVPPARKRTVTSYEEEYDESSISPPKKSHKKHKEKKSEPETIKTYSQIMEEKRKKLEKQREKKAKTEEKSKRKKITPIGFSDKENETILNEIAEPKKSPIKTEVPDTKSGLLETFSFTLQESTDNPAQSDQVDSSTEHLELLSTSVPENSKEDTDDLLEMSPTKKTSDDSWLEFSKEDLDMTGCEPADDDDLLREIDELLA